MPQTEAVELKLSEAEQLSLFKLAHEQDITLNKLVNNILLEVAQADPNFKQYEVPAKASSSWCQPGLFD